LLYDGTQTIHGFAKINVLTMQVNGRQIRKPIHRSKLENTDDNAPIGTVSSTTRKETTSDSEKELLTG